MSNFLKVKDGSEDEGESVSSWEEISKADRDENMSENQQLKATSNDASVASKPSPGVLPPQADGPDSESTIGAKHDTRTSDDATTGSKPQSLSTEIKGTEESKISQPTKTKKVRGKLVKKVKKEQMDSSDSAKSEAAIKESKSSKSKVKKLKSKSKKKSKRKVEYTSEETSSSSDDESSDSSSSSSSSDEDTKRKKKSKSKKSKKVKKTKRTKAQKEESSDSAAEEEGSDSDDEASESESEAVTPDAAADTQIQPATTSPDALNALVQALARVGAVDAGTATASAPVVPAATAAATRARLGGRTKEKAAKGSKAELIRLDNLWSKKQYRFVTQPSTEDKDVGKYEAYAFNVIRYFDYQNRFTHSSLKIMSKHLKHALIAVMGKVHGISLEEATPSINPNMVFLHLDELKAYSKKLKAKAKKLKKGKRKERKKAREYKTSREHLKILTKYLDEDYEETIKSLGPLLKSGKITFDLVWALFKCNEICYSSTYGHEEQPRAVKVSMCFKDRSIVLGDYYRIECHFLDYNGEKYGMAEATFEVKEFKGVRKITSLPIYPLKYHREPEKLTAQLIERGKKFVELEGMKYKSHSGMAYFKKDNKVIKVNVNGRIMLDPATFRRVRPNYQFSSIKLEDPDIIGSACVSGADDNGSDDECDSCGSCEDEDSEEDAREQTDPLRETKKQRAKRIKDRKKHYKTKIFEDSDDPTQTYEAKIYIPSEDEADVIRAPPAETNDDGKPVFTEEEYLIASPVALGFSFGEKLWLEFSVSGVSEIEWNEGAFESLIIPDEQKTVVKAMVESHGFAEGGNIDDVIRGKGKGLVAVLHGPPGTGKTLTAEGIAELLKKPLYSVSVGELGTTPPTLERSLTSILDIAHTWSALLLLDEADVFLEERTNFDIHRNALVSIFLRMLEYFQGILFLTTNRVAVFDPAFASRIHVGLRYGGLDIRARKKVWGIFLEKVGMLKDKGEGKEGGERRALGVEGVGPEEIARLAGFELNGREIKNAVRTAQSVALVNKEPLNMKHLLQVLGVGNVFAKDLKGAGYEDAMRSYM